MILMPAPNHDHRGPAVVQRVRTEWTKASRGGEAATARNAAPIAFPLFSTEAPALHDVVMAEHAAFSPEHTLRPDLPDESELELRLVEGRLRVRISPSPWGMPRRHRRPPAVYLEPGRWLRWQINYRFGMDYGWEYRLETWNIAFGVSDPGTFLGTPDHIIDERASLR
jgi:hypothetical protein